MRWRAVHHVEFAVLDYDDSIAFYDEMFGWLGYISFRTLHNDYRSTITSLGFRHRTAISASNPPAAARSLIT
jgi:hypothetical protein